MDKRYQVFVSSTYEDLKEERQQVMQALLELDCIPAGMELFPAADEDQWTLIKRVIDDCDYYLVIIGGRYGSLSSDGISYTQKEYQYAVQQGRPVMGFIHNDPKSIPAGKSELDPTAQQRLVEFKNLVQQKVCKSWSNPAELGSVVSLSLNKLIKQRPAVGWVRADLVPSQAVSDEILRLRRQVEEQQERLASVATEGPTGIEDFAQGEECFEVHFTYELNENGGHRSTSGAKATLTWDEIFCTLAPQMLHDIHEDALQSLLGTHLRASTSIRSIINLNSGPRVNDDDFQRIKIQLRALGLIEEGQGDRSIGSYWKLTPYGDNVMTRLMAIKR